MSSSFVATWVCVCESTLDCAAPGDDPRSADAPRRRFEDAHRLRDLSDAGVSGPRRDVARLGDVPVTELVSRLRLGDQQAFETAYLALHDPLWRLGVILLGASDAAEEIVQDIFLAVWMRRETLVPDVDLRAYMYAALRNAARMRVRHDRVVGGVASAVADDAIGMPAHGRAPIAPDEAAEASEFYRAYGEALGALSERERLAVQLRVEEDLTYEQIGELLTVSKVAARTIVLRAEEKVRRLLAEYRT